MGAIELSAELRRRLGAAAPLVDPPLVSVVVPSHDGAGHLRTLLDGLVERTDYPRLELIVVDNGSGDDSVAFLRAAAAPFPISVLANPHNASFSDSCNQGAAIARGELLLFLNNDVEPFDPGWLRELVACLYDCGGAVGATLVSPHRDLERFPHGFAVQCRGLRFRDEDGTIGPALHDWEADPFDERLGEDVESPVVVGACVLVAAELFERVGGFPDGYVYGAEDIDLCLRLRAAGSAVVCSGRSLLIHRPGSTRRKVVFEQARERKLRNHRLLRERWGPLLRREHDLAALAGGGMWVQAGHEGGAAAAAVAEAEALGVCVRASDPPDGGEGDPLAELRESAVSRGHRFLLLRGDAVEDPRGLELDIAIHLRGRQRYVPASGQLNVLWTSERRDDLSGAECDRYDLVLGHDAREALRLAAGSTTAVVRLAGSGAAALDMALAAAESSGRPTRIGPNAATLARRAPA